MLRLGSRAMLVSFSDYENRPHPDHDYIATRDEIDTWIKRNEPSRHDEVNGIVRATTSVGGRYEFEIAEPGSSAADLLDWHNANSHHVDASPEAMALIKRSHLHKEIKWHKHIADYHFIRTKVWPDKYGVPLVELLTPAQVVIYNKRVDETNRRFPAREPKLDVTNEEFFGKKTPFVHDHIHEIMAYYHAPLFTMCKRDQAKAWVELDMFKQLSHADQVRMVREEAYTIATERFIVPAMRAGKDYGSDVCFADAVKFVCTRLFRDFWRDFAIEHWPEIKNSDKDYVKLFLKAVMTGRLKLVENQ